MATTCIYFMYSCSGIAQHILYTCMYLHVCVNFKIALMTDLWRSWHKAVLYGVRYSPLCTIDMSICMTLLYVVINSTKPQSTCADALVKIASNRQSSR